MMKNTSLPICVLLTVKCDRFSSLLLWKMARDPFQICYNQWRCLHWHCLLRQFWQHFYFGCNAQQLQPIYFACLSGNKRFFTNNVCVSCLLCSIYFSPFLFKYLVLKPDCDISGLLKRLLPARPAEKVMKVLFWVGRKKHFNVLLIAFNIHLKYILI